MCLFSVFNNCVFSSYNNYAITFRMACFCDYDVYIGIFVCAIACYLSYTVRYYLKMASFFLGSMLIGTFLPIPWLIMRPRDYRNAL